MYDLIVIGAGPGGYVAAERAGQMGKKVLLIEKAHMGGVCTNWGCIPTKALLNSAKHYVHAKEGAQFGVHAENVTFNLTEAMTWKTSVIEQLRKGISYLMKKNKVVVVKGEAVLLENRTVQVGDDRYTASNILVATGSSPFIPPIPGHDLPHVMTSRQILDVDVLPEKLVIIGGGVIGLEFASFFSSVGVDVTVVEMMAEVAPLMDPEFSKLLRRRMDKVKFILGARVESVSSEYVTYSKDGKQVKVEADKVLMSVGRRPNTAGLEKAGIDVKPVGIVVDECMKTNLPGIWAAGDVTGRSLLAHAASRMAEVAVANMFGSVQKMRYHAVPWAIYTNPEAAGCGLTEADAKKAGLNVKCASMQMMANGRYLAEYGKTQGLCKVIVDAETNVLLGVHLLGAVSSEMIHSASAMIEGEFRVQDIREIIFPHPSVSEIIKDTLWEI